MESLPPEVSSNLAASSVTSASPHVGKGSESLSGQVSDIDPKWPHFGSQGPIDFTVNAFTFTEMSSL